MIIIDKLVDLYYAVKFKAEDLVFTVRDGVNTLLGKDPYASSETDYVVEDVVEGKPKKKRGRKPGTKTKKKKK